jgi:mannan endo-1,4-beta-mannosidase
MPRIGRTALLGLVAALVVVIAVPLTVIVIRSGNINSQAPRGGAPATQHSPAQGGMLWGMWIKDSDGQPDPSAVIASREAALGHRLDVFHWYESWDSSWSRAGGTVDTVSASGRIPMITWEADDRSVSRIAQGGYDAYVDSWAKGAASRKPHEIWIRVFHEFNIPQYAWSTEKNRPADLVAAWRHVHDRFAAAGADNVRWIWNPDGSNPSNMSPGYPGDAYVDYTGWDTYGYEDPADYRAVSAVSQKPMVIGEFGPSDDGGVSGLKGFTDQVAGGSYPLIRAMVYFDEGRWAIKENPSVRDVLKQMLASPAFRKAP